MSIRILCALAFTSILVASTAAEAGRYYRVRPGYRARPQVVLIPWGLYVGGGLVGSRVLHQEGGEDLLGNGAGLTLYGGMRLHPALALELGWIGTMHEPRGVSFAEDEYLILNGFTTDARVYLPVTDPEAETRIEPYLQGGLGVYLLDNTYFGTQSTGTGFQLGAGFDATLGPFLQLGLRGLYRGMAMGPVESRYTDTYVGALTAELDLTIRF